VKLIKGKSDMKYSATKPKTAAFKEKVFAGLGAV
jgi:hypothetical protein